MCTYSWKLGSHESLDDVNYWRFHHQLLHTSLQKILEPIRPYMTAPKVVHCPDGHYHQAIFLLGPYIANYPEQCLLACIVQGFCPWYVYIYFSLLILILLVLVAMLHQMILILDNSFNDPRLIQNYCVMAVRYRNCGTTMELLVKSK